MILNKFSWKQVERIGKPHDVYGILCPRRAVGEPNTHVDISLDLTILTSCLPESASTSVSQESQELVRKTCESQWLQVERKKQKIERASSNVQNRTSVLEEEKQASFTL